MWLRDYQYKSHDQDAIAVMWLGASNHHNFVATIIATVEMYVNEEQPLQVTWQGSGYYCRVTGEHLLRVTRGPGSQLWDFLMKSSMSKHSPRPEYQLNV